METEPLTTATEASDVVSWLPNLTKGGLATVMEVSPDDLQALGLATVKSINTLGGSEGS